MATASASVGPLSARGQVVWVRPVWAPQMPDGEYRFEVGTGPEGRITTTSRRRERSRDNARAEPRYEMKATGMDLQRQSCIY